MKCVVMKLDTCIAARIGSNVLFRNHRASSSVVSIIQAGAPNNHALDIYSLCGVTPYNITVATSESAINDSIFNNFFHLCSTHSLFSDRHTFSGICSVYFR